MGNTEYGCRFIYYLLFHNTLQGSKGSEGSGGSSRNESISSVAIKYFHELRPMYLSRLNIQHYCVNIHYIECL